MSEVKKNVKEVLDSVKNVTVATSLDCKPFCRVMQVQKVTEDLKIWFASYKNSPKVHQIECIHDACIVASNEKTARDVRLFGKMETFSDLESKKNIWQDELKQFFPGGIDDPSFIVIVFSPEKIEFRDMKKGGLKPEEEVL